MFFPSRHAWFAVILTVLCGPALALDGQYYSTAKVYRMPDHWLVGINLFRKSCFVVANYSDKANVEMGVDRSRGEPRYYMAFFSRNWGYEPDRDYEVIVKYDGKSVWKGKGVGFTLNATRGVGIEDIPAAIVEKAPAQLKVSFMIGGRGYNRYPLAGIRDALTGMGDCIREIEDERISLAAIAREFEPGGAARNGDRHRGKETVAGGEEGERRWPVEKSRLRASKAFTGTGFFVNADGYLLTNAQMADKCENAMVRHGGTDVQPAAIVASDRTNDLAILKVARKSPAFGKFRGAPQIRLGDSIVVFGYPPTGFDNITMGRVSALAGAGDDVTRLRISAPVQSGDSGGAVIDQSGHVVGVVVAGGIQNVNFAIKAGIAQFFLDANQVQYDVEAPGDDLKTPDVVDIARNFSVQVACEVKR
ncbi:MAG: serine protease [Proteobacteria bacterium]|nr:serine protease [Pseudomonadota bacterium]